MSMMNPLRDSLVLLATLAAAPLAAQVKAPQATTRVDPATVSAAAYTGFGAPMVPAAGTHFVVQPRWMGSACPGGCLVAQGSASAAPSLNVRFPDGSVRGARATLLVGHDQPHTLRVSLDGSEVMGFSCNGRAIRLQAPGNAGFRWAVYQGGKRVSGGTSAGGPVDVPNPAHAGPGGGPMQLSVQQRDPAQLAGADDAWCKKYGCLQLSIQHGDQRIVVMPVLDRSTPFAMRDLGVTVSGVPAFALTGFEASH